MSVKCLLGWVHWGGETHPKWEWYHPMGWGKKLNKRRKRAEHWNSSPCAFWQMDTMWAVVSSPVTMVPSRWTVPSEGDHGALLDGQYPQPVTLTSCHMDSTLRWWPWLPARQKARLDGDCGSMLDRQYPWTVSQNSPFLFLRCFGLRVLSQLQGKFQTQNPQGSLLVHTEGHGDWSSGEASPAHHLEGE